MPKTKEKRFKVEFELYARGKRRTASVSASFGEGQESVTDIAETAEERDARNEAYEKAYSKLHEAAREFCQHLINTSEL